MSEEPEKVPPRKDRERRGVRIPVWFWMLLFMAACLFGFGVYVVSTLI